MGGSGHDLVTAVRADRAASPRALVAQFDLHDNGNNTTPPSLRVTVHEDAAAAQN